MTRMTLSLVVLTVLAGCGVEGDPIRPTASASVSVGESGVYSNVGLGVSTGYLSVFLGL